MLISMNTQRHHRFLAPLRQRGVSLIELMITVAILTILLTVVGPGVGDILTRSRITAEINELSGLMQYARHQAIDEQTTVLFCPTANFDTCSNDWSLPKMVFLDPDVSGARDGNEEILVATGISDNSHRLTGPAASIRFVAGGTVASPATLLLCHNSNDARYARALTLSLQGRVKLSQDSNNDGVHEDNAGNALSCL